VALFSVIFVAVLSKSERSGFGIIRVFIDSVNICFSLWRTGNLWFADAEGIR
jgi:hypothetical protein